MVEQARDVYEKFYPNLLEADMPIENLIKELQNIDLFTNHHVKELEDKQTQATKIKYVLDHIKSSLESGNAKSKPFTILLKIWKKVTIVI